MSKAKTAAGYVRISKSTDAGLSIQAQIDTISQYCEANGYSLTVFVDDGFSGKNLSDRNGLKEMITGVSKGQFDTVIVTSISRLSRSVQDVEALINNELSKSKLIVLDMNIDTSTPSGRFMLNVMSSVYQFERNNLIARTKAALKVKKDRNEALGRKDLVRYGYSRCGDKLVENEAEQIVVKRIIQLKNNNCSFNKIAKIINLEGMRNRAGNLFAPASVRNVVLACGMAL